MALALFKERRMSIRKQLTGLLPGKLVDSKGKVLNAEPVDVSEHGLGIVTQSRLDEGEELYLVVNKERTIRLKVIWSSVDFNKNDLIRYGLECSHDINLEEIFIQYMCLK